MNYKRRNFSYDAVDDKFRSVDSHMWIDLNHVTCISEPLKLSIGDSIMFTANVSEYRGQVTPSLRGYKYGVDDITIVDAGYLQVLRDDRAHAILNGNYPRHGDWIVAYTWDKQFGPDRDKWIVKTLFKKSRYASVEHGVLLPDDVDYDREYDGGWRYVG